MPTRLPREEVDERPVEQSGDDGRQQHEIAAEPRDVGVRGRPYVMTKRDLTHANHDLLEFCGSILREQPSTRLQVARPAPGASALEVTTRGLSRLDLYVDGRPEGWTAASDGTTSLELPAGWSNLEVWGFADGVLRQRRRL